MEILIAMFIFAVVLSTIYTSYTGTFRIVDETESQAEIYAMARVALERMQEDLESVYIPLKGEKSPESDETEADDEESAFIGKNNEIEGRSTDSLLFTSRAHLVFSEKASGTAEIAYDVKEDTEGEGFVLYRTDTPPAFQEKPEEGTGGLVLCDSLVSVNFTYYDDEGEEHGNWPTSDELRDKIPKMVSIKLEFKNSADIEAPFTFMTSVALPMGQG